MTPSKPRPLTPAVRVLTRNGVPADVAWAARDAALDVGIPLGRVIAVAEAESSFRNVWGHDAGKWREDGSLTAGSVRRYWSQPPSRRPNGAGVWQLTYEPFQRQAEERGGLHLVPHQAAIAVRVLAGLPSHGATPSGLARYNGSGPAAAAYGQRVHQREAHWSQLIAAAPGR